MNEHTLDTGDRIEIILSTLGPPLAIALIILFAWGVWEHYTETDGRGLTRRQARRLKREGGES